MAGGLVVAAVLVAVLLLPGAHGSGTNRIEGKGAASPEKAVEAYLTALQGGDVDAMLQTFAVESYVEEFDLEALLTRMQAYSFSFMQRLPNATDFERSLNLIQRQAALAQNITFQYLTLTQPDSEILGLEVITFDDDNSIDALLEELEDPQNLQTLQSLELVGFRDPSELSENYDLMANQKNVQKQEAYFGCDDLQSVVAEAKVGGERYLFCFDVGQYGEKWYIINLQGNIGVLLNISVSSGGVIPASEVLQ